MINVAAPVFSNPFFRQHAEFTRITENPSSSGETEKTRNTVNLVCIIQPAGKDDLAILPEGSRYNPVIRVMTQQPVNAGDELFYHGTRWRIINDAIWSDYGYYDMLATRYEGSQTDDSEGFVIT